MLLHTGKTSETSVKTFSLIFWKDVGIEVPRSKEIRSKCSMQAGDSMQKSCVTHCRTHLHKEIASWKRELESKATTLIEVGAKQYLVYVLLKV